MAETAAGKGPDAGAVSRQGIPRITERTTDSGLSDKCRRHTFKILLPGKYNYRVGQMEHFAKDGVIIMARIIGITDPCLDGVKTRTA